MPQLSQSQIKTKIKTLNQELGELMAKYNELLKNGASGRVIHEDAASEYKFFQRQVLEGKIKLTEEIIEEYQEKLEKKD